MNFFRAFFISSAFCLWAVVSHAGPAGDALTKCITENTTGKDRKDLAKWIFTAMSSHPEIRQLANLPSRLNEETSKTMGQLVTKLLADACPAETKAAFKSEGASALKISFEALGRLAMLELTTNQDFAKSLGSFEKHIDQKRVKPLLE